MTWGDGASQIDSSEVQTAPAPSTRRPHRLLRRLLGLVVVGLWCTLILTAFAGGYRIVDHSTAVHDFENGQITSYAVLQEDPTQRGGSGLGGWWAPDPGWGDATPEQMTDGAPGLVYTVPDSRPRVVVSDGLVPGSLGWSSWSPEELQWVREDLMGSEIPSGTVALQLGTAARVHGVLGMVLAGGMLTLVLAGPAPRHGTRWFWFWLIGLPAGLGVLAYAVWELGGWRDHRAPAPALRSRGGYGVMTLLLGSFLIGMVLSLLMWLLGTTVIPL